MIYDDNYDEINNYDKHAFNYCTQVQKIADKS